MITVIGKRTLSAIPTLLLGVTLVFLMLHLLPGDPAAIYLGPDYTEEAYQAIVRQMGLDKPLLVQYVTYMKGLLVGNLGKSLRTRLPVASSIASQFPYTLALAISSLIVAALIGIPAGILSAVKRDQFTDRLTVILSLTGISMPGFWLGILLILLFTVRLGWLPSIGGGSAAQPLTMIPYLVMPALASGVRQAALITRLTRSSLLETLNTEYVRTARAKGLKEWRVVFVHAFRNALLPVITTLMLDLGVLMGRATVIEKVFNRPGIGSLLVEGILTRDYPLVQGTMVFFMVIIILANALADIAYTIADPRIRR